MSKQNRNNAENLPTVDETLAEYGLKVVPEPEPVPDPPSDVTLPSWVTDQQSVSLPPNLLEQLMIVHRERDAAQALANTWEAKRDGLFTGFLMGQGLPIAMTYDLATGTASVPKAE